MRRKLFNILLTLVLVLSFSLITATPAMAAGPAAINLGMAGNFAILAESGVTNVPTSVVTGNIGVSPIAATAITGFGLIMDGSGQFSTSPQVTGKVYAADYASPTPANLITAVSNMEAAYTDAAGRPAGVGPNLNVGGGTLNGQNFTPGLYTWNVPGNVNITGDITLTGSATDVWIFQITGTLDVSSGQKVILRGGARAANIFWVVAGVVSLGTTSTFNGNILAKTNITMTNGATLNGRALAQTAVTLIANVITVPSGGTVPPLPGSTKTVVASSDNPSVFGQSVTFTATVTAVSPASGTPTGTVQFKIDGNNFGIPVNLAGGSAISNATAALSVGSHSVTAVYSGDLNFLTSSGTLIQVVKDKEKDKDKDKDKGKDKDKDKDKPGCDNNRDNGRSGYDNNKDNGKR